MILAIDPSINNTGWAILYAGKVRDWGVIKTDKGESVSGRLVELHEGINAIAYKHLNVESIKAFVEVPGGIVYNRSINEYSNKAKNIKSLLVLSEAVGCICTALRRRGIEPNRIVAHKWKAKRTKELDKAIASSIVKQDVTHDEADAILLAIYCEHR